MSDEVEHKCLLVQPVEDILKLKVDSGIFIDLRRKWLRFCMISPEHPDTGMVYKSQEDCRYEERKHIVNYMMMIHPFSLCCLYWEFWMFLVFIFNMLLMTGPAARAFTGTFKKIIYARFFGDLLIIIDIFKNFFTGYYCSTYSRSILNPSAVAKHYLKFYYWVDILSSLVSFTLPISMLYKTSATEYALIVAKFLGLLKILRMPRWMNAIELFKKHNNIGTSLVSAVKLVLTYIILVSWLYTIIFYLMNNVYTAYKLTYIPLREMYLMATFYVMVVTFGEVTGKVISRVSISHILIAIFGICVGYILQLYLIAKIMQVCNKLASGKKKNENLLQQFKEFVKYKALPPDLRERIFMYFDFKYQDEYFNEYKIHNMAAISLRKDMLFCVTRRHMRKVKLLKSLPEEAVLRMITKMKSEIYLPDDIIVKCGLSLECMFFINYGTVAVFAPSGKELCHLEDGTHFGDINLVYSEKRVANVVAVTACELFRIKKSDFMHILEPYPNLRKKIINIAYRRLLRTEQEKSW